MQDKIGELKKTHLRELEEVRNKAAQADENAKEIQRQQMSADSEYEK